ncbi:ParA family protein [Dapis sp. BLCC M126]|uniref:ParA family protein n=1 Tax=Dapis sp. BLCC M126 TaxID=3400189 RepID=UPI003CE917E3
MAKTIAFANLKGGTGKTTICINIAGCLTLINPKSRVLVVDFDPQANATSGLGIDEKSLENSIYDVVLNQFQEYQGVPITQTIVETQIENLHLVPSELNLAVASILMHQCKDQVGILNRILAPIKSYYDYILIDVPSDTGLFMLNSLRAADEAVIPIDSSIFSLEALEKFQIYCQDIQNMTRYKISRFMVVLNRYTKSKTSSQSKKKSKNSISEEIEEAVKRMSYPLFKIPESLLVYRSQQEGMPISHFSPTSQIVKNYMEIANYLS